MTTKCEAMKIPMAWGLNSLRGKSEGALFGESFTGDGMSIARGVLLAEAKGQGLVVDEDWVRSGLSSLLALYSKGLKEWRADRGDTIGFVYEMGLPSGRTVLMGEERVLSMLPAECGGCEAGCNKGG